MLMRRVGMRVEIWYGLELVAAAAAGVGVLVREGVWILCQVSVYQGDDRKEGEVKDRQDGCGNASIFFLVSVSVRCDRKQRHESIRISMHQEGFASSDMVCANGVYCRGNVTLYRSLITLVRLSLAQ